MPKIPAFKVKEVIKILEKVGFIKWRQKGSHLSMHRKKDNISLTVPIHFGRDVPKGTLRTIINQSGMTVEEFLSFR